MLTHEETMRLITLAQQGDEQAKSRLVVENTPLLKSIIKRYMGKHVEYDDLFQISSIGLLKAINNFSLEYNVRFSTYAVPMILGEVKRYMRDDGYIKVSRSLKSQANKIAQFVDSYRKKNGEEPTVEEIAEHFGIEVAEWCLPGILPKCLCPYTTVPTTTTAKHCNCLTDFRTIQTSNWWIR